MKKRIVSTILTLSILLSMIPMNILTVFGENGILYGDADGNGKVELLDVNLMERYIEGDADAVNNLRVTEADVNVDGVIDEIDVQLVKDYLVGNLDSLTPVLCTLSFETNGGGEIAPITVGKGYGTQKEIPSPAKEDYIFTGWVDENGNDFYPLAPVMSDMTLTAVYAPVESNEEVQIDSFALTDQSPDLSFSLSGNFASADEVKSNLTFLAKDGWESVELQVTDNGDGTWTVKAVNGFRPGGSYELTLQDGLTFTDKDARYRTVAFTIYQEEEDTLNYNPCVLFYQDTWYLDYNLDDGTTVEVLDIPILSNDENTDPITGTFEQVPLTTFSPQAGDIVCIYETTDPRERDYTQQDYTDDATAFIRITEVTDGSDYKNRYFFESLNEDDLDEVLWMPDTIPYQVSSLPSVGQEGLTLDSNLYDHVAYAALGNTQRPEFKTGDLLILYTESFQNQTENSDVAYGIITSVWEDIVKYKVISAQEKENLVGGLFVKTPVTVTEEDLNIPKMEAELMAQVEQSNFVNDASALLASNAMNMESVQTQMRTLGFTQTEIQAMAAQPLAAGYSNGRVVFQREDLNVDPTILVDERYDGGFGINVEVSAIFSVSKKTGTTTNSLKIEVTAAFEEQVDIDLNVSIKDQWKGIKLLSKLEKLYCNASIDVKSYSAVSVGAKFYTVKDTEGDTWTALQKAVRTGDTRELLRELNNLRSKQALSGTEDESSTARIQEILDKLPKVNIGGQEYSIDEVEQRLGLADVSGEFEEILTAEDETGKQTGLEQLMDKYSEMVNTETDWITLIDQNLFQQEFYISIVAVKLSANFLVHANLNLAIGADLEYEVGKRYNFWIEVRSKTSGSSEMDLLDERFGFQFYMMGVMGVRIGIKMDVAMGILTTGLGSIGANVEFGPYIKLHGYFLYVFIKERPQNSAQWIAEEKTMGALHMEFGLYLIVKFKAQILFGLLKYEPTLYDGEFPLLTAGVQNHVYDFSLDPQKDDLLYVLDEDGDSRNGVSMALPEAYRRMKTMNVVEGKKEQIVYENDNFYLRFTNPCFSMTDDSKIFVDPPEGSRRETSDMIVTWKNDKLAFSKYDISITVPVAWTNLSEGEMNKVSTATVMVGNEQDGFETVWSAQYNRLQTFDLPSQEEVLERIGYHDYDLEDGTNLKYEGVGGYRDTQTTGLTIIGDTNYIYDIQYKDYTLTVEGVQSKDGSETTRTYTTVYGKPFLELGSLSNTGAENATDGKYSTFQKLIYTNGSGEEAIFALDTPVNLSYISTFGNNGKVYANYSNDARTATFTFRGVNAPDMTVSFRSGDTPAPGDLVAYVQSVCGEKVTVESVTPMITASESSMQYIVSCVIGSDYPIYQLNYEIAVPDGYPGGQIFMSPSHYLKNSVIFEPNMFLSMWVGMTAPPQLSPWYYDKDYTQLVDFETARMPEQDMTIYARVLTRSIKVHYIVQGTEISVIDVPDGGLLQDLPTVSLSGDQIFLGWFSNPDGTGEQYNYYSQISTNEDDFYLYAKIGQKEAVSGLDAAYFEQFKVNVDYNRNYHRFTFELGQEYLDKGIRPNDFTIQWRPNGAATTVEWQEQDDYSAPVNAGVYDIKLSWPGNGNYLPIDEILLTEAIVINKIPFPTTDGKPLGAPKVEKVVGGFGIWTPNNFDRYMYNGDNVVTYVLDYMAKDGSFINCGRASGTITGNTTDFRLYDFEIADPASLENISIDTNGFAYFRARMEIAEGTNYLGVTTSYGTLNALLAGSYRAAPALTNVSLLKAPMNSGLFLSAADIETMRGQEFELTLNLDQNPGLWGMWSQVNFDNSAFELLGYTAGDVFSEENFTTQNDLSKDNFLFVATNDNIQDTTASGKLITLKFRVKDDAPEKAYSINTKVLQATNAQGEVVQCEDEYTLILVNTRNATFVPGQEPTCTQNGVKAYYTCTVCKKSFEDAACTKEITDLDHWKMIAATGHAYGEPVFQWSEDGKSCTVVFTCQNDPTHIVTEAATIDPQTEIAATCTEMGTTRYTASITFENQLYTDTKDVVDIASIGHNYGAPVFQWSEDGKSCSAVFTCQNDSTHVVTETATVNAKTEIDATCTEMGTTRYTASVTFEDQLYEDHKDIVDIASIGHDYKPEFQWADDGKSCTVVFTCQNDPAHVVTETATVYAKTEIDATCTEMGTTRYTASIELEGQTYTDTKDVIDLQASGHKYGAPVFQWADDGKSCTVVFTCQNDATHTITEEAAVDATIETAATCSEMGTTRYTASVVFENQTYTDSTLLADVEAVGHGETEQTNVKDATCTEEGYTGDKVCMVCGEIVEQGKTTEKLAHSYKDGKCTVCGAIDPDYYPNASGPQTNDNNHLILWLALLLVSGGTILTTRIVKRKNKKSTIK